MKRWKTVVVQGERHQRSLAIRRRRRVFDIVLAKKYIIL